MGLTAWDPYASYLRTPRDHATVGRLRSLFHRRTDGWSAEWLHKRALLHLIDRQLDAAVEDLDLAVQLASMARNPCSS